jgi:hypothetical protein
VTTAADLSPGDTYRAADGIPHTVLNSWSGGIRTYIQHVGGEERILSPKAVVTLAPERTPDDIEECIPVIYLDGSEGSDLADILFNVEGVIVHGITLESAGKAFDSLIEWVTPGMDREDTAGLGGTDRWVLLDDRWLVSGNPGLGYVALTEVTRWKS